MLESYNGGISVQQYEQIKKVPGVEIAAPIAFIGYTKLPAPLVQFVTAPLSPGYYRVDWTLRAFNGRQNVTELGETQIYHYKDSCDAFNNSSDLPPILSICGPGAQRFLSPDTGTFLMAAIDPTAENQLVHLDKSVASGRMLTEQDAIYLDPNPYTQASSKPSYRIPVLIHRQLPGQITLQATFAQIAPDLSFQQVRIHGGADYLLHLSKQQTFFNGKVPLVQNDPERFAGNVPFVYTLTDPKHYTEAQLIWDGHEWLTSWQNNQEGQNVYRSFLDFTSAPSGLMYQPTPGPAGQTNPAYTLVPQGVQGSEAAFRTLTPQTVSNGSQASSLSLARYSFDPIGEFEGDKLTSQFSDVLNWLPENTYTFPPTMLRYDAGGHPVKPTNLMPTTNPAGFILQPPLALTTLKAAEQLRGQQCISAIRIRVNGVEAANQTSWKRALLVAQLIKQKRA